MAPDERALLLMVARILRAQIKEAIFDPSGNNKSDYEALTEALVPFNGVLVPFNGVRTKPINEEG